MEDIVGGTFTVSNGGVFGSLMGTPIINLPQSAILGMHSIKERPMAVDGKVEFINLYLFFINNLHHATGGNSANDVRCADL
jgi:2-oxoglutarate dehydrogenase E2 component (dihydrolipoamide succinyltransferase)